MSAAPNSMPDSTDIHEGYEFTFGTFTDTRWKDVRRLSWDELAKILTEHGVGQKEGTCIVPAVFYGQARKKGEAKKIDVAFLDSDAGFTLDEIAATVGKRGWSAIISSSHSHMTTRTKVKRSNWDRYLARYGDVPNPEGLPADFLADEKGYLDRVTLGARIAEETGEFLSFEHQPCPKFRIVIPLSRPWVAAAYPDQAKANAAWKDRVEALAASLQLDHDQSCTDTSRLFYLPRRAPGGASPETRVIHGAPCDIFALPLPGEGLFGRQDGQPAEEGAEAPAKEKRARKKKRPEDEAGEFADEETGELIDLSRWARRYASRFEIVAALQTRRPNAFVGKLADGVKHHIRCVNEDEHTNAGEDGATFVTDASKADNKGFVYHCRHGHCTDRDRFFFLRKMLCEGWLKPADLTDRRHLVPDPDEETEDAAEVSEGQEASFNAPPSIRFIAGELPSITDKAERALIAAHRGVYQRGERLVRPGLLRLKTARKGEVETLSIVELGEHALVEELTRAADWEKYDMRAEAWLACDAPSKVAKTLAQRVGRWKVPVLSGIINAPTLREDGSILSRPGWDKATGLLLQRRGAILPEIPEEPDWDDARAALSVLQHLLETFPFVSDAHRAVALSVILTACIRRSLPTAPLHAFTAPVMGSGKSKLVDIASVISTGREAGVIAQGKTEEEMEKRLGGLLMAGVPLIAIDNCEAPLGGEILCQMLTQTAVRTRVLGLSEVPELPSSALVTATGNNLVISGDMTRRALVCRIDPQVERPEMREFASDPVVVAKADRGKYLAAALTVLRAYHVAGRPEQAKPLGSFETWSGWVRDALIWAGAEDPVATMMEARKSDPKLEDVTEVITLWREHVGVDVEVTVRALIERATAQQTNFNGGMTFRLPDFREVLLKVGGSAGAINGKRLGKWLGQNRGRIVDGLSIEPGPMSSGIGTWKVTSRISGL